MQSSTVASSSNLAMGARLLRQLPAHLRRPLDLEAARRIVHRRIETRGRRVLDILRRAVFDHRQSPYQPLLEAAGCEFGDLERLVAEEGVEGALRALLRAGVYLTVDEYKGRCRVERPGISYAIASEDLRNPLAKLHVTASTSGSRGTGQPVLIDLEFVPPACCGLLCG